MADKLQKYRYEGTTPRQQRHTRQTASLNKPLPNPTGKSTSMAAEEIKAEILSSLKGELAKMIREELKSALAEDFDSLKAELKAARSEIANSTTAIRAEVNQVKADIEDVKGGLSTWSDEVASLQITVGSLQNQVATLKDRCEDMEGRMRRGNIRIVGIDERPDSSNPAEVAKVIKQVLQMDRDIKIDRSHRGLVPWKPGDRPRVIIAKLHYDGDAAEILRRARDRAPLTYEGKRIAIFPDYTSTVAKARAAFTEVRKALRGRRGVRYGLLFPARLRISHKDADKEFLDPKKAMEYVQKTVIPSTEQEN